MGSIQIAIPIKLSLSFLFYLPLATFPEICLSHINKNSIRNKLDSLLEFTYGLVDFHAVCQTKLDSFFSTGQFNLPGFRIPYRNDLLGEEWRITCLCKQRHPPESAKNS